MLSQTVEYALRAMVYLASHPGEPSTAVDIARVTRVPPAYLSKILQNLSREGLVNSRRGLRGGFSIATPADELTVLEVINAVEPVQRIDTCPLGLASHGSRLCPLHARLDRVLEQVEQAFGQTTLAEILAEPTASIPLCEFPAALPEG